MTGPLADRIADLTAVNARQAEHIDELRAANARLDDELHAAEAKARRYAGGLRFFHAHAAYGPRPLCEPDKYVACEAEQWLNEQEGGP